MGNEKDAKAIHQLFLEYHYADDLGVIKSRLAKYVATVRKEEREEAFQDALNVVLKTDWNASRSNIIEALEAAALTEK